MVAARAAVVVIVKAEGGWLRSNCGACTQAGYDEVEQRPCIMLQQPRVRKGSWTCATKPPSKVPEDAGPLLYASYHVGPVQMFLPCNPPVRRPGVGATYCLVGLYWVGRFLVGWLVGRYVRTTLDSGVLVSALAVLPGRPVLDR